MTVVRLVFFLFFVAIMQNTSLAYFGADSIPQIVNPDTLAINYCSDSVLVSPNITVKNIVFDESTDGMKVSVANYRKGEDILVYDTVNALKYYWNDALGFLEIKGIATTLKYQEALRKVYYKNKAAIPNLQARSFSISLLDADYLPQTQHFYRYIKKRGIKWSDAKAIADTMKYYGLKGYLATITSSVENDFIWLKIDGVGWIGASDEEKEGTWKWMTGPEKGMVFWQGDFNGGPVGGLYSFWNTGEPNNVQKSWGVDEDYAHINANPGSIPKSWNDLPDEGDKLSPTGYYYPEGYIVEFAGFIGEPQLQLSAIAKINLAKIAFSDVREYTICAGSPKEINLKVPPESKYSYNWTPNENISSVTVSNPVVNPYKTTIYTAIGKLDFCIDTADFLVSVNPLPEPTWKGADTICKGNPVTLDPGVFNAYLWETGATTQTIFVKDEGWYSVRLTNEFNCKKTDSTLVKWSVIPELDYSYFDTLVCGSKTATLNLVFKSGNASTQLVSLQPESATVTNPNSPNPVVTVDKFGIYFFKIVVTDKFTCEFTDTLKIEFHNQPTALFQIDDAECEGYNLKLYYKGDTVEDALFKWYSSDTLFFSGINADTTLIPLGYGSSNRSVALKINEKGCTDSLRLPVTVTPVLDFWAKNPEGCTPLNVKFDYTATEKIANFYWEFGDGTISTDEKPVHPYENKDTNDKKFDVSLKIVSIEGCENTGFKKDHVTTHPIPTLDLDFQETDCNNETSVVNYVGSANDKDTFFWDLNSFLPAEIIANPGITKDPLEFKRSSEPTVKIGLHVVSTFGCKTKPMEKTWKRKPVYEVDIVNAAGCPPLEPGFIAKTTEPVDKVNYIWNFGDGNTSQTDSTKHIYSQPDEKYTIQVVAKSDLTQCSDTVIYTDTVNVYPVPTAHFIAEPPNVIISNPVILFSNASENATAFEWDFGDESALSDEENPEHRYNEMGLFDVQLTSFNSFGCIDTAMQQVSVTFDKLFPPTAFSPNAIAVEDREFRIYSPGIASEGYQLLVFNRWGEIIFESNSQEIGWDGRMKNSNFAPTGVYNWVIQYIDFRGEKHKQQGSVTLLF